MHDIAHYIWRWVWYQLGLYGENSKCSIANFQLNIYKRYQTLSRVWTFCSTVIQLNTVWSGTFYDMYTKLNAFCSVDICGRRDQTVSEVKTSVMLYTNDNDDDDDDDDDDDGGGGGGGGGGGDGDGDGGGSSNHDDNKDEF